MGQPYSYPVDPYDREGLQNQVLNVRDWQAGKRWRSRRTDQDAGLIQRSWQADSLFCKGNRGDTDQMNALYAELQWLPRAPLDYSERLKLLGTSTSSLGYELQALASHALDLNQLTKLAKSIVRARSEGKPLSPLTPFRLAVLSN